jgi:hypothetical protein
MEYGKGDCVEVVNLAESPVGVRDTKDKGLGRVLVFTHAEWTPFCLE